MRRGQTSRTAEFIAISRALGHLHPEVPGFDDPVSAQLISPESAAEVERVKRGEAPSRYVFPMPRGTAVFNQFRTVVLDRAIIAALPVDQLVILGAGLDGRAYRLAQLGDTTVFEVDHPDTQREKRERAAALTPVARDVRYVAMDFERDLLDDRLTDAGFQPSRSTFWLLEGVTMYLATADVRRLLSQVAALSSSGSRLALTYFEKTRSVATRLLLAWIGLVTGEHYRSGFDIDELDALVRAAGWETRSNTGITDWKRDLAPGVALGEPEVGIQWRERIWIGQRTRSPLESR